VKATALDRSACETLAKQAAAGDASAGQRLVETLWPWWLEVVKAHRSLGGLRNSPDHVHNVIARLVAKVKTDDGHALRMYVSWQEQNPEKDFLDWIHIVTANVVRDYVREQVGSSHKDEPSPKRLLNEYSLSPILDELGRRPPITEAQTARELLEYARCQLPPDHWKALEAWLKGGTFEDIDRDLGVPAGQGRKFLRAAVATLRRQFAGQEEIDINLE